MSEYHYSLSRDALDGVPVIVVERRFRVPEGAMEQTSVIRADTFEPIRAESRGPERLDLAYSDGRIRGLIDTGDTGRREVDIAAPAGTLLPYAYEAALAAMPLHVGFTQAMKVLNPKAANVGIVGASVIAETSIAVPAGTFRVYEVELTGFEPSTLFVRKQAPHILIRQDLASSPVSILLKQLNPAHQ